MAKNVYNTIRTIYALFAFNFVLCALSFWATHTLIIDEEQNYVFSYIIDNPYLSIVSGYLITYAIMSLIFSVLFIVFRERGNIVYQYFKIFGILFLVGLSLYITAWLYWDIGKGLSGISLIFKMLTSYVVDQFVVYLRGIMLWFAATIVATYAFVRMGLVDGVVVEK